MKPEEISLLVLFNKTIAPFLMRTFTYDGGECFRDIYDNLLELCGLEVPRWELAQLYLKKVGPSGNDLGGRLKWGKIPS